MLDRRHGVWDPKKFADIYSARSVGIMTRDSKQYTGVVLYVMSDDLAKAGGNLKLGLGLFEICGSCEDGGEAGQQQGNDKELHDGKDGILRALIVKGYLADASLLRRSIYLWT